MSQTRTEHDSIGEVEVPADALWRAQTQRAIENFPISGTTLEPRHVRALALVKAAAATVNADLGRHHRRAGRRDRRRRRARWRPASTTTHFPLDVFQTGSGTSSNMNMNEVLASLAGARRRRGPPQRPRQRLAVLQRHLPDRDPRRRDAGRRRGPAARRSTMLATSLYAKADRVRRRGQVRPHAPDGRDPGDARPGVRRATPRRCATPQSDSTACSPASASSPSAAPPSAPGSTPRPASPPR